MRIKHKFKYLSLLFLIPTIIVVFSISAKPNNPLIQSVIAQLSDSKQGLKDKQTKDKLLEDIDKLRQFNDTEKEKLIAELNRAITDSSSKNPDESLKNPEGSPTNPDVFKPAKETLESLRNSFADVENSDLESLQKTFPEVQQSNLDSIKASSKIVVETLDKMIEVIALLADKPINPEILSENLKEVQTKVGATSADGYLGITTTKNISDFLNQQNTTLVAQLGTLRTEVESLQVNSQTNVTPEPKPADPSVPKTKDDPDITSQIEQLEKDNNFLKKLIFVTSLLSIANLFALLRIIWFVDKRKKENNQQLENVYSNLDNQISNRVNNLREQISGLKTNPKKSETSHQSLINARTFNRSWQDKNEPSDNFSFDDDDGQYPDNNPLYNQKSQKIIRHDHPEEEAVEKEEEEEKEEEVQVRTYPKTELVQSYNDNRKLLAQDATKVAITKSSLEQDRLGSNQAATLNENPKGDYFIIREKGYEYLFPGEKLKVNPHNLSTVENLFVCTGYESSRTGKFKLIQAAVVSRSSGKELVLQQPGELRFL